MHILRSCLANTADSESSGQECKPNKQANSMLYVGSSKQSQLARSQLSPF